MKNVSLIATVLLLFCLVSSILSFEIVHADIGTVYIRANGSVDPPSAPISNVRNISYTFTNDIYASIVVERDNILVDGAGYVLEGQMHGIGISIVARNNVTIKSLTIRNFDYGIYLVNSVGNTLCSDTITNSISGIYLYSSSRNNIYLNSISNNYYGVYPYSSSGNSIYLNTVTSNNYGIYLFSSLGNAVYLNTVTNNNYDGLFLDSSSANSINGNTITSNFEGIRLTSIHSSDNKIYHNNFEMNNNQAHVDTLSLGNVWDDGNSSSGNFWSDYSGVDGNNDSIGDTPYVIDANNIDRYPLMNPWMPVIVLTGFSVVNGGSGYTTPHVVLVGGGGTGATATARVSQGVIYWNSAH